MHIPLLAAVDVLAQQDFKTWYDGTLDWAWTAIRRTLLVAALVGGITYLAVSRSSQRALRFAVIAAVFLGVLFNLDSVAGLIGSLFQP